MKKMNSDELYYMDKVDKKITIENKSYNFIKSLLFQFEGFDKIILVEDKMTKEYVEYLLRNDDKYYKYNIIFIGGHDRVIGLMNRNKEDFFFGTSNIISILDGDQNSVAKYQTDDIKFIPFLSVEKSFMNYL
jgi:hypothetical protein